MADETEKTGEEVVADSTKTPEQIQQDEVNTRAQAFLKEYGELVGKHKIDFATYPMFVPDGQGGFKIITQSTPVDISNQPVRSNFMQTN